RQDDEEATSGVESLHWRLTGLSQGHLNFPNPEIGVGSGFRVLPKGLFWDQSCAYPRADTHSVRLPYAQ
ncbi:hypothetical protein TNCV_4241111, partial [Trichonephila clavipes]